MSRLPVYLVGSKADLEDQRQVALDEGRRLAIQLRCQKLFEISSKTHTAEINDLFEKLVLELMEMENSSSTPQKLPMTPMSQKQEPMSPTGESPRRNSNVFDRFKFGSLKRKASLQSMGRKKSGSFGERISGRAQSRSDMRSASYGKLVNDTSTKPSVSSSPYRLDVDTSSWRETIKWPTEIIPEEELKTK